MAGVGVWAPVTGVIQITNVGAGLVALAVLVLLVSIAFTLSRVYRNRRVFWSLLALRLAAAAALCVPLFEPVRVTADVVPDENFVAILLDNSASMSIADGPGGASRLDVSRELITRSGGLADALGEVFKIRYYTFGGSAQRVDSIASVEAVESATNLAAALDRVRSDFRGVPLAGIVLLSDGGDSGSQLASNSASELAAADVPVHAVGIGSAGFPAEREILDAAATRAVERATGAEVDVKVRSWERESAPVEVSIYRGSDRVHVERRMLKGGGRVDQFAMFFEPPDGGATATTYRVVLEPSAGELNTRNNEIELLVDTRMDTTRVLYFEGALRQDFKFIKRALEDDQVVDFVSVSRTGTGKYYRQGIRSSDELAGGFPATEDELFAFDAVIFGDIEASAFTLEQQRMLERFVRVRGGGFLMLGGLSSFAEGDYWNTPIADVLPVAIDPQRKRFLHDQYRNVVAEPAERGFRFVPTAAGLANPALKLSPDPQDNRAQWAGMPGLTSLNLLGATKPGAIVLAEKSADAFGESEPILVTQRYGRGRGSALASSSLWRWQMLLEATDMRHERFWRQLVRWQASEAPGLLNVHVDVETPAPGQQVSVSVDAFRANYDPLTGVEVRGVVVDPRGVETPVTLREDIITDGKYVGSFVPSVEGIHAIRVTVAGEGGDILGGSSADAAANAAADAASRSLLVRPSRAEFYDATLKSAPLREVASITGGAYYEPTEAAGIAEAIRTRRTHTSIYRSEYVWDTPFWLGLAMLLLCAEWFYRRRRGLA